MIYNFLSFFPGAYINSLVGIPTREQATCNWPLEKHVFSRLIPQTFSNCPWDLFIDIANVSRTGNCNRLKSNGMSFGIKGIRGIKTSSPLYFPFKIVALMTLLINFFSASRAPVQRRGWFLFHSIMIIDPIFNCRLWGVNPSIPANLRTPLDIWRHHLG